MAKDIAQGRRTKQLKFYGMTAEFIGAEWVIIVDVRNPSGDDVRVIHSASFLNDAIRTALAEASDVCTG